jgi:hypothetical protein
VEVFSGLIGMVGLAGLIYVLNMMRQLSNRLGAVTKMAPYYRAYSVAAILCMLAFVTRLLRTSVLGQAPDHRLPLPWLYDPGLDLAGYHLPLAVALTISLVVTWRYWAWLLRESG